MKIYITRKIPEAGIKKLQDKGYEVTINSEDRVLAKEELTAALQGKNYDAVLCLLTDKIDDEVLAAAGPQVKIFANYAVGVDNIDLPAAKKRGIIVSNTPGVLTESVAELTIGLIFAITKRIVEADEFTRRGKFVGWAPMLFLGTDLKDKTLGIIGLGRIGGEVARRMHDGFGMNIIYFDAKRNEELEKIYHIEYADLETLLKISDVVSVHVPLLPATRHLIDAQKLAMMKPSAYLINTSRGPIIDEIALEEALKNKVIRGAAIDVYENEPALTPGLAELDNIVLTPHIASASLETRSKMAEMAADNIIAVLENKTPPNPVKI
ncbi:MAG: D-glycerate dehydrogenase [bacterium]|nr:D-glycerate dehydrogenase [bacterium]